MVSLTSQSPQSQCPARSAPLEVHQACVLLHSVPDLIAGGLALLPDLTRGGGIACGLVDQRGPCLYPRRASLTQEVVGCLVEPICPIVGCVSDVQSGVLGVLGVRDDLYVVVRRGLNTGSEGGERDREEEAKSRCQLLVTIIRALLAS